MILIPEPYQHPPEWCEKIKSDWTTGAAEIQKYIVHQIRNSLRFVSWIERKAMAKDLKLIYTAATEEEGSAALEEFAETCDKRYPHVSTSWKKN